MTYYPETPAAEAQLVCGPDAPDGLWTLAHRADKDCLPIADRHYNRQKVGSPQFVPPGRCLVLKRSDALWVTSWPFAEYVKHAWAGAWVNSCFRHEGSTEKAANLIRAAVACTRWKWPDVPTEGLITFIDPLHVRPRKIRSRPTWGWTYFEAGFKHVGYTKAGLWAFHLARENMPPPCKPVVEAVQHVLRKQRGDV